MDSDSRHGSYHVKKLGDFGVITNCIADLSLLVILRVKL